MLCMEMDCTITKEGNYCNFVKPRDLQKNGFSFHTSNGLRVEENFIRDNCKLSNYSDSVQTTYQKTIKIHTYVYKIWFP